MSSKFKYQCTTCQKEFPAGEILYLCPECEKKYTNELPPKGILKVLYKYKNLIEQELTLIN